MLPIKSSAEFLQQNVELAIQPWLPAHRMGYLQIVGLITNKWTNSPTDFQLLQRIAHEQLGVVFDASLTNFSSLVSEKLRVVFWIAKALVLKGDKFGLEVTARLVELLRNPIYGATASRGFGALLREDTFLCKENYATVRLLMKQKVFAFCVPKIVDGFKGAHPGIFPLLTLLCR